MCWHALWPLRCGDSVGAQGGLGACGALGKRWIVFRTLVALCPLNLQDSARERPPARPKGGGVFRNVSDSIVWDPD